MIVFSIAVPVDLAPEALDWLRRMFKFMRSGLENEFGIEPITGEINYEEDVDNEQQES